MPSLFRVCSGLAVLAAAVVFGTAMPSAAQDASQECLTCHSDPIDVTLLDGTTRTLRVHEADVKQSVHADVACVDCHPAAREIPHPDRRFASNRQFSIANSEQCRQCHFTEFRQSLESTHAQAVARGDTTAPTCVDCHGSHTIGKAGQPRTRVADACGRCHTRTAAVYRQSVHGADVARNSADVPTCTDCHGAHRVAGPTQAGWRSSTPEICGGCHSDPARMKQYGISTAVLKTYVSDFHGKTASLHADERGIAKQQMVAVCSDCHGTHNVARVTASNSPVVRANVTRTCRSCHPNASVNFPDAWLSHYEPDWKRAPVLMSVKTGYAILIPFMIGGMGLQILLHLWRMAVNR